MIKTKTTLTAEEKLAVLRGAMELLGRGGKNWIKNHYFGYRVDDDRVVKAPVPAGANCWCLEGAMTETAVRLGLGTYRAKGFGSRTSLRSLVRRMTGKSQVWHFNDHEETTWKDVREMVNTRIKELEKEIAEDA